MRVCKQRGRLRRPAGSLIGIASALFLSFGAAQDVLAMDAAPLSVPPAGFLSLHLGGLFGAAGSSDEAPASAGVEAQDLLPAAPRVEQRAVNPLEALAPFLPAPGEWRLIQGLQFERFRVPDSEANAAGIRGTAGSTAVLSNRTGSAFDPEGHFWYFWGGGTNAYGGNEVYRLDLAILQMSQITQPSILDTVAQGPAANNCLVPSDGPAAASTYDGMVWSPDTQSFFVFPSNGFCPSGVFNSQVVWEFDPFMGTWDPVANMSGLVGPVFAEHDPATGRIFVVSAGANATFREFDPVTAHLGAAVPLGQALSAGNAVLDAPNDRMIVFAQEGVFAISLANPGAIARLGDVPSGFDTGSGAAFDTRSGLIALWDGGKQIRTFDPVSAEWTLQTPANGPAAGPGGVFSKWIAIQELGIFAGYQNADEGLWLYRLPSTVAPAPANSAPVALVGSNQIAARTGRPVTLDGSASFDADHDSLTFSWDVVTSQGGVATTLSAPNQVSTAFTAPLDGTYVVRLTVSDGTLSDTANVTVTAANASPVANAGADQSATVGDIVSLSGGGTDTDGDSLTFHWSFIAQPAGSTAALSNAQSATPSFRADTQGAFTLRLSVSDADLTGSDEVTVLAAAAAPANNAPLASAGPDQTLIEGQTATLSGLLSSDPDNDALTYAWALTSRPTGSTASLSSATGAAPTLHLDVAGDYLVDLTVSDGQLTSAPDRVKIIAAIDTAPAGGGTGGQNIVDANPSNYKSVLSTLQPGDTMLLESGTYTAGMTVPSLNGEPGKPIIISGPADRSAVILARDCCNTVQLENSSHLVIRDLTLDGQNKPFIDGVNARGVTHHITIENLEIINHGAHQLTVGISTKGPAWDWVIRNNIIRGAGTGLYLGNSDGNLQFVRGLIEHNLVVDTVGYNMQIKHQNPRPGIAGMPTEKSSTVIRHNVFSKANQPTAGFIGARPNLLVGHFPLSGPGADDVYEIYGNFFYQNLVGEPLFQGEGNIAFYDNLLVNNDGEAAWIQPHNDKPKMVRVFHNTVVARDLGIRVSGGDPLFTQSVIGNAVFAATPIQAPNESDNIVDSFAAAGAFLSNPTGVPGTLDLYPQAGVLRAPAIPISMFAEFSDFDKDFNGDPRDGTYRGAYAGEGTNSGWLPQLARQPLAGAPGGGSTGGGSTGGGSTGGGSTGGGSPPPPAPLVTFSASPTGIQAGQSSTLTWSSTNATTCSASGGWNGTKGTVGNQAVTPSAATTYTLTCTGTGGSDSKNVSVAVSTPPGPGGSTGGSGGSAIISNLPPGTWYEAPNTKLRAAEKKPWDWPDWDGSRSASYNSYQRVTGITALIANWNSGTFDPIHDRFIVFGGGHNDYGGNEIFALNIATLTWQRVTDPTPFPKRTSDGGTWWANNDGTPISRHTYNGVAYITHADRLFIKGGAPDNAGGGCITPGTWTFDSGTNKWQLMNPPGDFPGDGCEEASVYDPVSKKVYYFTADRNSFATPYAYDFDTNRFTQAGPSASQVGLYDVARGHTLVVAPQRRKIYSVGTGYTRDDYVYDLTAGSLVPREVNMTGDQTIPNSRNPGLAYDPISDKIVGWFNGIYAMDLDTLVWTKVTPAAGSATPPRVTAHGGVYGRFQYVPSSDAFVTVNSVDENVFFFKPDRTSGPLAAVGGAVPPPPTPAPTTSLTAAPNSILSGGSTTLTWGSTNATSCTAGGGWSGTKANSGSAAVAPTADTTYTLTCVGVDGANSNASVTVTVSSATGSGSLPLGNLAHDGPATPEQMSLLLPVSGNLPQTATASVRYKQSGSQTWKIGHPLHRIRQQFSLSPGVGSVPDAFAWPIIDLQPGTSYDVEVTVTSDSISDIRTASFATRNLPAPAGTPNKTILAGSSRAEIQTALDDLLPGDVIEIENGTYNVNGGLELRRGGTRSAPIYVRGKSRGGVMLSASSGSILKILDADHVIIENITLLGPGVDGGSLPNSIGVNFLNSSPFNQLGITIRNVTMSGVDAGILAWDEISEFLAYDNTLIGNNEWSTAFFDTNKTWNDDGIRIPGFGNAAFNNTLIGFGDSLSYSYNSSIESVGVHFYRNNVRNSTDDFTEVDDGHRNLTSYDNRSHNSMTFISLDPIFGGPFVAARNIAINVGRPPYKWNSTNTGQFIYNNTVVRTTGRDWVAGSSVNEAGWIQHNNGPQRAYGYRNNILVYRGVSDDTLVLNNGGHDIVDFTHNSWFPDGGFKWHDGWSSNLSGIQGGLPSTTPVFSGIARRHELDNITVSNPWTTTVTLGPDYRTEVIDTYTPALSSGTAPKNSGAVIPNITDGFNGAAPDRGAVIAGRPTPLYGDRLAP